MSDTTIRVAARLISRCINTELRLKNAKNLPKKVEEYVSKFMGEGYDESYAWAMAWSIYCKHKNPDSSHCQKGEYLKNQGKK